MPRVASLATANLPSKIQALTQRRPQSPQGSAEAYEASLGLGVCLVMNKQYGEAMRLLEPLATQAPLTSAWSGWYLGLARFKSGDLAGALESFAALADGPPDLFPAPDAQLLAGYCLEGLTRPGEALERYRQFLAQGDNPLRAVGLWRAAVCAAQGQDFAAADEYLRELLEAFPWTSSADKALPLAQDLARQEKIGLKPDSPSFLAAKAQTLLDKSMAAKAWPAIEQLAQTPGSDPARVLYLKGKALYARRDTPGLHRQPGRTPGALSRLGGGPLGLVPPGQGLLALLLRGGLHPHVRALGQGPGIGRGQARPGGGLPQAGHALQPGAGAASTKPSRRPD